MPSTTPCRVPSRVCMRCALQARPPGIGDAVAVEIDGAAGLDPLRRGSQASPLEQRLDHELLPLLKRYAMARQVEARQRDALPRVGSRMKNYLQVEYTRAVAPVRHREWRLGAPGGLRDGDEEGHAVVLYGALARRKVQREVLVGIGRLGVAHQVGRIERPEDEVVDELQRLLQFVQLRGAERKDRLEGGSQCRLRVAPARDVGRAVQLGADGSALPAGRFIRGSYCGPHRPQGLHRADRELAGQVGIWALAIKAVAQAQQIFLDRLRRERPREGDVAQPRPGDVAVVVRPRRIRQDGAQRGDRRALLGMVDGGKRRARRLAIGAVQAVGNDDGVLGLLVHGQDGLKDEGVGLALVPSEEVVDAVDLLGGPQRVRPIENAVEVGVAGGAVHAVGARSHGFVGGFEHEILRGRTRVVGEVGVGLDDREGEDAASYVEQDGHAGLQVDDVDGVVGRVPPVGPHADLHVVQIDGGLRRRDARTTREPHGDGRESAPAFHLVELRASDLLDMRRRYQARVDATAGAAGGIGKRRDVVRRRDVGERLREEVEDDHRALPRGRGTQANGDSVDGASGEDDGGNEKAQEGEAHGRSVSRGKRPTQGRGQ